MTGGNAAELAEPQLAGRYVWVNRNTEKRNGNGGRLGKYETMLFCIFREKDKTKKTGVKGYGMQI